MIKINITSDTCTLITFINYIKQQTTSVLLTYPSQRERERERGEGKTIRRHIRYAVVENILGSWLDNKAGNIRRT